VLAVRFQIDWNRCNNFCKFFYGLLGVDPLKDVEKLGKKLGFTLDNKKFHNVSLGQGQEVVAESALDVAAEHGHWVVLQVSDWQMETPIF